MYYIFFKIGQSGVLSFCQYILKIVQNKVVKKRKGGKQALQQQQKEVTYFRSIPPFYSWYLIPSYM